MTTALRINGLHAGYHGVAVVRDLDLVVEEGEVVVLLGPNGAGKTTTLLTVSGLLPAIEGEIEVLGGPVEPRRRAHRMVARGLGHVPEDRALFPRLTVDQHLRLTRQATEGQRSRIFELLPPLVPLLDRRAGLLSGGEQQMLALAKALMNRPRLLLIDEMSLGLAPVIVESLMPLVRRLASEEGTAVLLVEQHVDMALEVADRAYILSHGQLMVTGSAADLQASPDVLATSYLGVDESTSQPVGAR